MKKFCKVIGIISGIIAAIGLTMIIVGAATGGIKETINVVGNGNYSFGDYFDDEDYTDMSDVSQETIKLDSVIKQIDLDGKAGDFRIKTWENDYIGISADNGKAKYTINGETLNIKGTNKMFNWFGNNNAVKVVIYIPNNYEFDDVSLDIGAGNIETESFTTQKLEVNIGAGNASINNVSTATADLEVGAGNIDMSGIISGNSDIDCGLGNINLKISNMYEEFNYTVDVGLGKVKLGERKVTGKETIDNQAEKTMNIDCGMGNVEAEFGK